MHPRLAKQAAARKGMKEIVRAGPDGDHYSGSVSSDSTPRKSG
jgi:hypothetical protein